MTRRIRTLTFLSLAFALFTQTATPQDFDMTRPVTMQGKLAGFATGPGSPTYILLEVTDAKGQREVWAVQGSPIGTLVLDGWTPRGPGPLGQPLSIVTFRVKAGGNAGDALSDSIHENIQAAIKAGRLVRGTEVTLADGTKKKFS